LSKLALRSPKDNGVDAKEIQQLLESLLDVWETQARREGVFSTRIHQAGVLDEKLADYVFFPLSHILRGQDTYPMVVIETTIKLLKSLIQHGWKNKISAELSQQLLIFLTFIVGGVPGQERTRQVPEETILEGYRTLSALVKATGSSTLGSAGLLEEKMVPTLGHSVSVILDGVTEGLTPDTQLAALDCVHSLYAGLKDQAALASFLPGTVSKLTHLLVPPASLKTPVRVLVKGLTVFKTVLTTVLGDLRTRNILREMDVTETEREDVNAPELKSSQALTPAWLKATASQIKIALSSVLKLRNHDSEKVQQAVGTLCVALLDECHASLSECKTILVETAMVVYQDDEDGAPNATLPSLSGHRHGLTQAMSNASLDGTDTQNFPYGLETSLKDLVGIYDELKDTISSVMYSWVMGLPRVMQSSDERIKQQAIRNFKKGNKLLAEFGVNSSTLEDSMADALRDSIVALILSSKQMGAVTEEVDEDPITALATASSEVSGRNYRPIILAHDAQRNTKQEIRSLIESIGSSDKQAKLASEMLGYLRDADGVDQIGTFWLSFELVQAACQARHVQDELDTFLDLSSANDDNSQDTVFHELYDFSASILASHSDVDETDWRLEAIALEVAAFAAARMQLNFRPELIDVLFPITTFMGSHKPQLRSHAITTLNSIATSCGYSNVSELIIDNVDYMVNSMSLRLNTFDISPASTRVLTMMIRLSGPKLIPFLDDVVQSIFAALDNYHGYPVFVESLFSVLLEVVEQGAKSDLLLLEGDASTKKINHKKRPPTSEGIPGMLAYLDARQKRLAKTRALDAEAGLVKGHPTVPWGPGKTKAKPKSFLETLDEISPDPANEDSQPQESSPQDLDTPKPAPTPTYTLLTRITTLTQHHLTSPSPTLRRSLLDLLTRAAPALAADEDSFLPVVNAIWPTLIARLRDPEPFVVIAACDAIVALCASAGDFLSSRIKTEWWDWMGRWCARVKQEASRKDVPSRQSGGRGGAGRAFINYKGGGDGGGDILIPGRNQGEVAATPEKDSPMADMKLVQSTKTTSGRVVTSGLGRFAESAKVWSAVVRMLTGIVSFVRIEDEIFDQILELVVEILPREDGLRTALEVINADAVWLAMYQREMVGNEADSHR
jgi:hypothetical protein